MALSAAAENDPTDSGINKLQKIHEKIKLIHGNILEEYPEQLMAATYLPSDAKVLELGGNVGRNSCVIGSILNDSRNLVTMEPSKIWANQIKINRDNNQLFFHVEAAAVSKVPLIQRGWVTIPSEIEVPGYSRVDTITFSELEEKYQITFDTLVVDCEGALYYILKDDPDILKNIKLVIVENDYQNPSQRQFVSNLYEENGLHLIYSGDYLERIGFYEVWKK
jgi:FkbM family methyltransferase